MKEGRSMRLTAAVRPLYRYVVVKSKNSQFPGESTLLSDPYVSESIYYIYLRLPKEPLLRQSGKQKQNIRP